MTKMNTEEIGTIMTTAMRNSDEAVAVFNSGKPVWVIYSKPLAVITAIEKVTDGLVRITVNGVTGLHCASGLLIESAPRQKAADSNAVNRRFFNGLMKALGDE